MVDRVMAEFGSRGELAAAVSWLRRRGLTRIEAYTPVQAPEVEEAFGRRRSRLPFAVFAVGAAAAAGAYLLQWFLVAYLYPLNAGGRPPHFPLAFVIITFEMGILFSGLAAFFGVLILGRLLRLTDVPQSTPGFRSATRDRYWLEVSTLDPRYDPDRIPDELRELGALHLDQPRLHR